MQLTVNYSLSDFASKDGAVTPNEVIPNIQRLANNIEHLNVYLGAVANINSGYRSAQHNANENGSPKSQHLTGKAGDIWYSEFTPEQVRNAIIDLRDYGVMDWGGLGIYDSFIHFDQRGYAAEWDYRTNPNTNSDETDFNYPLGSPKTVAITLAVVGLFTVGYIAFN